MVGQHERGEGIRMLTLRPVSVVVRNVRCNDQ